MKNTFLLFITIISSSFTALIAQNNYKNVGAIEFKNMMQKQKGVLIDLRTPEEINKGKIKGAVEIDFINKDFAAEIEKFDKSKTYYLYCAGGGRSADASEMMISKGFKNIINLEKGFSDWKKQNFEIEKK